MVMVRGINRICNKFMGFPERGPSIPTLSKAAAAAWARKQNKFAHRVGVVGRINFAWQAEGCPGKLKVFQHR